LGVFLAETPKSYVGYNDSMRTLLCSITLIALANVSFAAQSIVGRVEQVKDADSIVVNRVEIRLYGIDAPEFNQECKNKHGQSYACGEMATKALRNLLLKNRVNCEIKGKDQYQRLLGVCRRGVVNINRYLVARGWAIAYERYDARYLDAQMLAKRQGVGLWQGEFDPPEKFRRAASASNNSIPNNLGSSQPSSASCNIKGNISSKGERIYHTPSGSRSYDKTRISERKGERWFCSEAEARAAGWRPPKDQ